jgi:hypothetical protein
MLMMNFGKHRYHTCSIMYTICYTIHVYCLQYFEMHIEWYVCVCNVSVMRIVELRYWKLFLFVSVPLLFDDLISF